GPEGRTVGGGAERDVQLGRPLAERRGAREIPVLERREKRRRRIVPFVRFAPFLSVAPLRPFARRDALVVPPQLVDREVPSRSLMLHARLDDRERARLEARPQILERTDERRDPCELTRGEEAADLEFRVGGGLDPAEQFQHGAIVDERDAVALIAAAARPFVLLRLSADRRRRIPDPRSLHAAAA